SSALVSYTPGGLGCGVSSTLSQSAYRLLATGARVSAVASDLLVLSVTIYQTHKAYRSQSWDTRPSLSVILLRDGTIYFAVLFIFNVCDIIFLQLAVNGALADFVTVLSVVLVTRFLLDLRQSQADSSGPSLQLTSVELPSSLSASSSLVQTFHYAIAHRVEENEQF
ncbi:hypothetical protein OH77DRAFT_1591012, partial [Trametes cingulata]